MKHLAGGGHESIDQHYIQCAAERGGVGHNKLIVLTACCGAAQFHRQRVAGTKAYVPAEVDLA